jgi:Bacterial regulatory proteins, luxR family
MPRPILSPRRRAVAILALSGLSNREIGYELGITPNTVTNTLHFVYDSLGIQPRAGRRDLGRALAAHGIISVLDLPAGKPPGSSSAVRLPPRPSNGTPRAPFH